MIGARFVPNLPYGQKSLWEPLMVLLHDVVRVETHFIHLEILLILTQDRCTVCAECTMDMAIILGAPDGTLR
jgi:hypothetical protein